MRVVFFGVGGFFLERLEEIAGLDNTEIVGISDNNESVYGEYYFGIEVSRMEEIHAEYDFIVITSTYVIEIREDLIKRGFDPDIIIGYGQFILKIENRNCEYFEANNANENSMNVLAITPALDYNGACLAIVYLLEEMRKEYGYRVCIASSMSVDGVVEYLLGKGISIYIIPDIVFNREKEYSWMEKFDFIIVNTLIMRGCLNYLNPQKTVWWLHESRYFYEIEKKMWDDFDTERYTKFPVFCVSKNERKVFNEYFIKIEAGIIEYGLPDIYKENKIETEDKLVVAVIGRIYEVKGQDIMLEAIECMPEEYRNKCEFWFIGGIDESKFGERFISKSKSNNIKVFGAISHEDLELLYPRIDVVVSSSREDSLPVVITEGFMCHKICIIPDVIGTAEYVEDKKHCLIYEKEKPDNLAVCIQYIIDNLREVKKIADRGRSIYEKYFSVYRVASVFQNIICEKTL